MADDDLFRLRATFDTRDAQFELDRLSKGMDAKTRAKIAARFEGLYQETQKRVHVLSGALRSSGRRYVRDNDKYWRGTITYGGYSKVARFVSGKPKGYKPRSDDSAHVVDYAALENALEGNRRTPPGTPHHFFDEDIEQAFDDIEEYVANWLINRDARNERRRASYAASRLAAGKSYTPRPR